MSGKKSRYLALSAILIISFGCSTPNTVAPVTDLTNTQAPDLTDASDVTPPLLTTPEVVSTFTLTPEPIPTYTLTPLPDPQAVISRATEHCEKAFQPAENTEYDQERHFGSLYLIMINSDMQQGGWKQLSFNPNFETTAADEIRTLICIKESAERVGQYEDGATGYRVRWEVFLVNWLDGKIQMTPGEVSEPPQTKIGGGDRYGDSPAANFFERGGYFGHLNMDKSIQPDGAGIRSVAFSPDGQMLAVGDVKGTITIIDLVSGQTLRSFRRLGQFGDEQIEKIGFLEGGKILAAAGVNSLEFFDVSSGELIYSKEGFATFAASPNAGRQIALIGLNEYTYKIVIMDVATREMVAELQVEDFFNEIAYSPDGKLLALSGYSSSITILDAVTGEERTKLENSQKAGDFSFSSDSQRLTATVQDEARDSKAVVWDVGTGQEVLALDTQGYGSEVVVFSPRDNILARANEDDSVTLWDGAAGKSLRNLSRHIGNINSLVFSPDGNILATGSADGRVILWDVGTGDVIRYFYPKSIPAITASYELPPLDFVDVNGNPVSSTEFEGKVVLYYLWNSYCFDCEVDMKTLEAYYSAYKDSGLIVVAVVDGSGLLVGESELIETAREQARTASESYGLTFPNLLYANYESEESLHPDYSSPPQFYVVDRTGAVRLRWGNDSEEFKESYVTYEFLEEYVTPIIMEK